MKYILYSSISLKKNYSRVLFLVHWRFDYLINILILHTLFVIYNKKNLVNILILPKKFVNTKFCK